MIINKDKFKINLWFKKKILVWVLKFIWIFIGVSLSNYILVRSINENITQQLYSLKIVRQWGLKERRYHFNIEVISTTLQIQIA